MIKLPEGSKKADFCSLRPLTIKTNGHEVTGKFSCGKFSCRVCGPYVRLKFMAQVIQGMEDEDCSFLTLTTRRYMSIDEINKAFRNWLKRVKRVLGKFEYVKVLEYQKNGNPHIHAILKKPVEWFRTKRYKEWNRIKSKNDFWIDKNDWLMKHWQEVCKDGKISRIALNPIKSGSQDKASSCSELSKYLSKTKSKSDSGGRWYSFSSQFRGCVPKLGRLSSTYLSTHHWELRYAKDGVIDENPYVVCNETQDGCTCFRPVIYWDFKHYDSVFINYSLMEMLGGKANGVHTPV